MEKYIMEPAQTEKKKISENLSLISDSTNTSPVPLPSSFFPLVNDSTAHIEISFMENYKYSEEIINEAKKIFDPEKLRALKEDKNKFLTEAKIQIGKLCQSIDALKVHTNLFEVTFLINLGYLLDEIYPTFQKRSAYTHWLENNFAGHSLEYFQHARRLSQMGDTAIKYRSLGVNRLLEVDRLEKDLGKSLDEILRDHSFSDTTQDLCGNLFKVHVDAIVSYYRYIKAGVDKIKVEQVLQIVQYGHQAIEVKEVKRFKKKYDEATDKDAFLEKYVMDKMAFTGDGTNKSVSEEGLNKMLAELNDYFKKRLNNSGWLKDQKELLDLNIFYRAYGHLTWLKKKLRAHPPKGQKSTKKKKR
jgi:hypothetical protein